MPRAVRGVLAACYQNTSGETKVTVYARIAKAVLPELFALNPNTVHDHVKSKLKRWGLYFVCWFSAYDSGTSLKNVYKKHVKRLCQTGEGVQGDKDDSQGSEETLLFYFMGDGPCVKTPLHAVNIWSASLYFYL